ncbi:MAG: hypothetical protein Q7S77_00740 [Candidatus Staskawiczbacteria bacterium]|nr:hypothetical protein [Candidatus Staskawiczbacteria bacterium]
MSLFSKKQEISLEDFCRDFYESSILNPKIGEVGVDAMSVYAEQIKKSVAGVDNVFTNVDLQKLTYELTVMRFELFALAWLHKFPDKLFSQSIFTYEYLQEKGRCDIWESMEKYNKAISSSVTAGLSKLEQAYILRGRADSADKQIENCKNKGIDLDSNNSVLISIGRPINRQFSNKAWKNGHTIYFLILALCHQLGLGYGPSYLGPNKEAQFRLSAVVKGFYDGAEQSWDKIKIRN